MTFLVKWTDRREEGTTPVHEELDGDEGFRTVSHPWKVQVEWQRLIFHYTQYVVSRWGSLVSDDDRFRVSETGSYDTRSHPYTSTLDGGETTRQWRSGRNHRVRWVRRDSHTGSSASTGGTVGKRYRQETLLWRKGDSRDRTECSVSPWTPLHPSTVLQLTILLV